MKLNKLVAEISNVRETKGDLNLEISGISYDSRQVLNGHVFIAVRGLVSDGHKYIEAAVQAGAVAIIYDRPQTQVSPGTIAILVEDSRLVLPEIASIFYGHPEENLIW